MNEICGRKQRTPFASYDRDSFFWKTSQLCLDGTWDEFSETWPNSGTMRNGACYRQPPLEHRTCGDDCGLLPTPADASKGGGSSRSGDRRDETPTLQGMARKGLWPTPNVPNRGPESRASKKCRGSGGIDLQSAVRMFPTPRSEDSQSCGNHPGAIDSLTGFVRMFPTPSANDWKLSSKNGQRRGQLTDPAMGMLPAGGQLNPEWVEWLMGWPIGWTDLKPLAMDRFREWLSKHGGD